MLKLKKKKYAHTQTHSYTATREAPKSQSKHCNVRVYMCSSHFEVSFAKNSCCYCCVCRHRRRCRRHTVLRCELFVFFFFSFLDAVSVLPFSLLQFSLISYDPQPNLTFGCTYASIYNLHILDLSESLSHCCFTEIYVSAFNVVSRFSPFRTVWLNLVRKWNRIDFRSPSHPICAMVTFQLYGIANGKLFAPNINNFNHYYRDCVAIITKPRLKAIALPSRIHLSNVENFDIKIAKRLWNAHSSIFHIEYVIYIFEARKMWIIVILCVVFHCFSWFSLNL